jgi:hypothetical protein
LSDARKASHELLRVGGLAECAELNEIRTASRHGRWLGGMFGDDDAFDLRLLETVRFALRRLA